MGLLVYQQVALTEIVRAERHRDNIVIDDDQRFCMAMSKALRRRGFEVEVVNDSELAIKALLDAEPNTVAVLDLKMPKFSGLEILKKTLNL